MRSDFWDIKIFQDDVNELQRRCKCDSGVSAEEIYSLLVSNSESSALMARLQQVFPEKPAMSRHQHPHHSAQAPGVILDMQAYAHYLKRENRCGLEYLDSLCACLMQTIHDARPLP